MSQDCEYQEGARDFACTSGATLRVGGFAERSLARELGIQFYWRECLGVWGTRLPRRSSPVKATPTVQVSVDQDRGNGYLGSRVHSCATLSAGSLAERLSVRELGLQFYRGRDLSGSGSPDRTASEVGPRMPSASAGADSSQQRYELLVRIYREAQVVLQRMGIEPARGSAALAAGGGASQSAMRAAAARRAPAEEGVGSRIAREEAAVIRNLDSADLQRQRSQAQPDPVMRHRMAIDPANGVAMTALGAQPESAGGAAVIRNLDLAAPQRPSPQALPEPASRHRAPVVRAGTRPRGACDGVPGDWEGAVGQIAGDSCERIKKMRLESKQPGAAPLDLTEVGGEKRSSAAARLATLMPEEVQAAILGVPAERLPGMALGSMLPK